MPVTSPDVDWISRARDRWVCSSRWSAQGATPSPRALVNLLWQDVCAQELVVAEVGEPVALLQVVNVDFDNGFGHLELLIDPERFEHVDPAVVQFIDRVFRDFPLRKLCLGGTVDELTLPSSLQACARGAGCFERHVRRSESTYADVMLYAIWSEDWTGADRTSR